MSATAQSVSPAESGGSFRAGFYTLLIFALLCVDFYHVWNYVFHHMSADSVFGQVFNFFLAVAIGLLAFVIKPATILCINAFRLNDPLIIKLLFVSMLCALLFGVFIATSSSQNTLSETRSNQLDTHGSDLGTLKQREASARSSLSLAKASCANRDNADLCRAAAQASYNRKLVRISEKRSELLRGKPLAQAHNAGFVSVDPATRDAIFSLFITLSGVVATIFSVMHIRAEHRIPAFSLAPKINQEWMSFKENYRSASFDVNPLRGLFNGMFFGHKRDVIDPSSQIDSPRVIGGKSQPKPSPAPSDNTEKTPPNDEAEMSNTSAHSPTKVNDDPTTYLLCPNDQCCALMIPKRSSLPSPDGKLKGAVRCDDCQTIFKWPDHEVSEKDGLAIIKQYNSDNGNSAIPEEFPVNSAEIPVDKQADSSAGNSSGISQEFDRNSSGTSKTTEFPKQSGKKPTLDLSHIAKSDPTKKKLKDLADTIDKLSADPAYDGMEFSPTKLKPALGMGYERIKPIFELKQREGKISLTKPFTIIYTGDM